MNKRQLSLWLAIGTLLGSVGAAAALKPTTMMARKQTDLNLEAALPKSFGKWKEVAGVHVVEPPGSDSLSHQIYNQEVSRGYADPQGHVVMFLVAYGESQSERLQLHRPEICYAAQGFQVSRPVDARLSYSADEPPLRVRRLETVREERQEPITYWMRIGYDVSEGVFERQRLKLEYGLRGLIPDGALFRVSTVDLSPEASFKVQNEFIRDLLAAVDPGTRAFMVGDSSKAFIPNSRI